MSTFYKQMPVKEMVEVAIFKDVLIYKCDFCDKESTNTGQDHKVIRECSNCKRHTCTYHGHFDSNECGDYPPWICNCCLNVQNKFQDKIRAMEDRHEKERDALDEELKQISLRG